MNPFGKILILLGCAVTPWFLPAPAAMASLVEVIQRDPTTGGWTLTSGDLVSSRSWNVGPGHAAGLPGAVPLPLAPGVSGGDGKKGYRDIGPIAADVLFFGKGEGPFAGFPEKGAGISERRFPSGIPGEGAGLAGKRLGGAGSFVGTLDGIIPADSAFTGTIDGIIQNQITVTLDGQAATVSPVPLIGSAGFFATGLAGLAGLALFIRERKM
ncbi:MAG: hypothetical protein HY760_07725 [Nitrospirae bacterium]|nr:hypothetical protein [Nitrospirota bacterium]